MGSCTFPICPSAFSVVARDTNKALNTFLGVSNFENEMPEDGRIWKGIPSYLGELANKR